MIVYDLSCANAHTFEGWFTSSADYEEQLSTGLLRCPVCDSDSVRKAPMAPAVSSRKEGAGDATKPDKAVPFSNLPIPPQVREAIRAIATAQAEALKKSKWVGARFAEEVRAQHYGEKDERPVHGKASADEARALSEEGIAIAPLLVPVADPDELN